MYGKEVSFPLLSSIPERSSKYDPFATYHGACRKKEYQIDVWIGLEVGAFGT
jgi:hypothetical protein